MKKFARVLALIMVFAMMLSMTAFAANGKTTWIRVSIEDDEGTTAAKPYKVYHWDESSRYLTEESPLLVEVVSIINKMYDPTDKTTRLWDFQSPAMQDIMDAGLRAHAKSESAWQTYVDKYFVDVNPVAGMKGLKAILRDTDSVVGDLEPNVDHKISFKNEVKGDRKYGVTYTVTVTRYTDVAPELEKNGDHLSYVIGYPDGTVRPGGTITRAEVATIFFRLLTDESRAYFWTQDNDFTDVAADKWYNNAISTMAAAGIVSGYPDGSFRPEAPVTRAEFAAIATRFTQEGRDGVSQNYFKQYFMDVNEGDWYAAAVELAYELGWAQGHEGAYRPQDNMSRAEVMTMINRILERDVKAEEMLEGMVEWPDNTPDAWYYEAVQEATNSHTYNRTEEQVPNLTFHYENWLELIENPDWAALEKSWSTAAAN